MVRISHHATAATMSGNRGIICQSEKNRSTKDGIRIEPASNNQISMRSPLSNIIDKSSKHALRYVKTQRESASAVLEKLSL